MWNADLAVAAAASRAAGVTVDVGVRMHVDGRRVVIGVVPSHQLPAKRGVLLRRPCSQSLHVVHKVHQKK